MKNKWLSSAAIFAAALLLLCIADNRRLTLSEYIVDSGAPVTSFFSGFRVTHISDLHNASFGKDNARLTALIKATEPDIIAITGDLVDSRRTDIDTALAFISEVSSIAPVYYVSGNHEARLMSKYPSLMEDIEKAGAAVLNNRSVTFEKEGRSIVIAGLSDPAMGLYGNVDAALSALIPEDGYTLLLSHRPELIESYAEAGADLVLSGHAHGGQFRLPFLGGMFAPGQGFFPKYHAGLYELGETKMVVSRGIGNSLFPLRVNNPPEVISIVIS